MPFPSLPRVALVIPTYNEAAHIAATVAALTGDNGRDGYDPDRLDTLIVDGGSSDGTTEIIRALACERPRLQLLSNPSRTQAAGCNLALGATGDADVFLRCDAHAYYPPGFLRRAVELLSEHNADVVVYSDRPLAGCQASRAFQHGVAFAQNNRLGVGQSLYRLGNYSGWVEHGKHGCFRRDALASVGGYDESFTHNEDCDLSYRLRRRGARIWLDRELWVGYVPRPRARALARQYYFYGRGRAQYVRKHTSWPSPRQWAPAALLLGQLVALGVAPWRPEALLIPTVYGGTLGGVALTGARRRRRWSMLWAAPAMATMHLAFGWGFLSRILRRQPTARLAFPAPAMAEKKPAVGDRAA